MGTNLTPGLAKFEKELQAFATRLKDEVVGDMATELSTACANEVKQDFTDFFTMSPTYRDERRKEVIRSGATKAGVEPVVHDKFTFGVRSTAPGARLHDLGGMVTAKSVKIQTYTGKRFKQYTPMLVWKNPPERGGGWKAARSVKIKQKRWMTFPIGIAIAKYMENDMKAKIDRPL
jgi:hypothetical protein